jgi:hypothetical protein
MTRPDTLRVFVDAQGVDIPVGGTALDAVRAFDASAATALSAGEKVLTDSRGLPVDADTAVQSGAIFRLIPKRDRSARPQE